MKYLLCIFFIIFSSNQLLSDDGNCSPSGQDTPFNISSSPLNKLGSFSVLPLSPPLDSSRKKLCDTVNKIVQAKLGLLGNVKEMTTNNPAGFGLSGVFLSFDIQQVETINHKEEKLVRISLSIPTMVKVKKSNNDCISYIWASSVFVENDADKNIEQGITQLLGQFSTCYQEANPKEKEKPIFYIYR